MSSPIKIIPTCIPGTVIVETQWIDDHRGTFSEAYSQSTFEAAGISCRFIQENHTINRSAGTVRGLHYQSPPMAQSKLIRVVRGAIVDVVVDVRQGSPWFGRWVATELSAHNRLQMFVPMGFAHGYCTLEPGTEVLYLVDAPYAPECEGGILWNDPDLAISWPVSEADAILNERDRGLPPLAQANTGFVS
jgi:dTDP-4-dehydrorhamnose 3,5-epimerase